MTSARERGAGSVLALCVVPLLAAAAWAALLLGSAVEARRRAAAAADLAALAAATPVPPACAAAERVAAANGGELARCVVSGRTVEVAVRVRLPPTLRALPDPVRRARAGPSGDRP